jgi:hypothetical protein
MTTPLDAEMKILALPLLLKWAGVASSPWLRRRRGHGGGGGDGAGVGS